MNPSMLVWMLAGICSAVCLPLPRDHKVQTYLRIPAVQRFREYVQIDTSVEENIPLAVEFWKRSASALGLPVAVHSPAGKPIVVITWPGAKTTLPSIMLNSHMDVVPVEPDQWTYPPFEAEMDDEGNIYGRGTQDAKDASIQYLEAVRKLIEQNVTLERTVHITLMPDEEVGGLDGMLAFRDTEEFRKLNLGFVLDEGFTSSENFMYASYQDKRPWQVKITVRGDSGHGSTLAIETAEMKLHKLLNKIHEFRDAQSALMRTKDDLDYGSYTSVNVNIIHGVVATNVIPSNMYLVADFRLATDVDSAEFQDLLNTWCLEVGNDTTQEFYRQVTESAATAVDETNPYWMAMQEVAEHMNTTLLPIVLPATSDGLYLRNRGYSVIGFSAKTYTVNRVHGHDEYLNVNTFMKGIDVYVEMLKKLGGVKEVA